MAQYRQLSGTVLNTEELALPGVYITTTNLKASAITDSLGHFQITVPDQTVVLQVSHIGYARKTVHVPDDDAPLTIHLEQETVTIGEVVVSTGYQTLSKDKTPGSYSVVDNQLLNRSVSTDILSRLEDIAPSLLFDRRFDGSPSLSIRGQSTISSDESPLIVVDNFPYEGDIDNINPNDIESITLLKDAAAASIWGVRAGNGVIVITTKRGREGHAPTIGFNANVTVGEKPDLFYSPQFLNSSDFIDVEQSLFEQGYYSWMEGYYTQPAMSPVVQLLIAQRDGLINYEEAEAQLDEYRSRDVRRDFDKYFYRTSVNRQYSLSLTGGATNMDYYLSAGLDRNDDALVRNGLTRVTINSMMNYRLARSLELSTGISYAHSKQSWNNSGMSSVTSGGTYGLYPYARLADDNGNPLAIVRDYNADFVSQAEDNGLLDWSYRPLQDLEANDYTSATDALRINSGLKYQLTDWLNVEGRYQYERENNHIHHLQSTEMYYTRDLINSFAYTDDDGFIQFPVPEGGILDNSDTAIDSHSGRIQLNVDKTWNGGHQLTVLAGTEIRQARTTGISSRVYGYNKELMTFSSVDYVSQFLLNPDGYTDRVPDGNSLSELTDRNRSYYGNLSYTFRERYMLSGSARKDESNLFGVDANNKGVPLWSAGAGWLLSSEEFYPFASWLPVLKLRATYGYSGNVNKSLTAYATGYYYSNSETDLPYVQILTPPNPNLRWEKVRMVNFGIDFASKDRVFSGSIEYYRKRGFDLIGRSPLDPTIGFAVGGRNEFTGNNSALKGQGLDIQLTLNKTFGSFNWTSRLLYSHQTNRITRYDYESSSISAYFTSVPVPVPGNPRYSIYSLRWAGLNPENGDPQIYMGGEITSDYSDIASNLTLDDLVCEGSALPTSYGSLRQDFRLGDFSIGVNISYKFGYYFRRPSLSYSALYNSWTGHEEFSRRWLSPGDEQHTNVPSMPVVGTNSYRDNVYANADVNVEKGDHVRLRDINLSYDLIRSKHPWLPFAKVSLYGYINNIGIIWRANKSGLDPDYIYQSYPASRTYSLGIHLTL
ncbi:SusC/RagA family TonB-linked outer membrane protein [Mangrovibacterium diazotrophicum]|nr:SusC/RagA family TonB-linked outer membrane protein [Mangrovibacterium diazotrophicum]